MPQCLPAYIDPLRYGEVNYRFKGSVPFSHMERLLKVVKNGREDAQVELHLRAEGRGLVYIEGRVLAHIDLICQRCLKPLRHTIDEEIHLGVLRSEGEAAQLPERYEPLMVGNELISMASLVEEEILLALPPIPRHAEGACRPIETEVKDARMANHPFSVLAALKLRQ